MKLSEDQGLHTGCLRVCRRGTPHPFPILRNGEDFPEEGVLDRKGEDSRWEDRDTTREGTRLREAGDSQLHRRVGSGLGSGSSYPSSHRRYHQSKL